MRRGRIAQMGTAHDLYSAPRSVFVAQFIGRVNLLRSRVVRTSGDTVEVDLWGQQVQAKTAVALAPGSVVSLALRPESVSLSPESARAQENEVGTTGTVRARTFLGEKVEYVVEAGAGLVETVAWDPLRHGVLDVGARVRVSCEPALLRALADDESEADAAR
jgi:ABC-type Fe3+/spermidine/putrescine transport system ATPase subunit